MSKATNTKVQDTVEKIKVEMDPVDFTANVKSKLMTTFALGEKVISPLFRSVFSDYEGCTIKVEMGRLTAELFFNEAKPHDDDKYRAIQLIGGSDKGNNGSMFEKIQRLNNSFKPNKYELTEDAKALLIDFMPRNMINKNSNTLNWSANLSEVCENVSYNIGAQHIYVKLSNVDIISILRTVYGNKEDDSYVEYDINIVKPVGTTNSSYPNMLVNIARLNVNETKKIASDIGIQPALNQVFMLR